MSRILAVYLICLLKFEIKQKIAIRGKMRPNDARRHDKVPGAKQKSTCPAAPSMYHRAQPLALEDVAGSKMVLEVHANLSRHLARRHCGLSGLRAFIR